MSWSHGALCGGIERSHRGTVLLPFGSFKYVVSLLFRKAFHHLPTNGHELMLVSSWYLSMHVYSRERDSCVTSYWPYRYVNSYVPFYLVLTGLDFSNYGCLSSGAYPTGVLVFTSKYPELECCSASQTTKDVLSFSSISCDHKTSTHYIPIYLFLLLRICL